MEVYDEYHVLFGVALGVLVFSLAHSTRVLQELPHRIVLALLSGLLLVNAYNAAIGNYIPTARITSAGYLMLATVAVAVFAFFAWTAVVGLVCLFGVLVVVCAGGIGGSDYGVKWLYDETGVHMTTNALLVVLCASVAGSAVLFWRLSKSNVYKFAMSVPMLLIDDMYAFSVIAGSIGAMVNGQDTYDVLDMDWTLAVLFVAAALWQAVPSYLAFRYRQHKRRRGYARLPHDP